MEKQLEKSCSDRVPECPKCRSCEAAKHGKTSTGKQRYMCMLCGKTFVMDPAGGVSPVVVEIASRLIREGVKVPVIAKAVQGYASRRWVYRLRENMEASCRK